MTHIEDVLLYGVAQSDWPYRWGGDSYDEGGFDCSGLWYAAGKDAGVSPPIPRTAYEQYRHCKKHGTLISVDEARRTRGAWLFTGDGTGTGRDAITHVAMSLGTDDTSIEARSTRDGIGTFRIGNRFQFAGLIPGVDYSPGHGRLDPKDDMFDPATDGKRLSNIDTAVDQTVMPSLGRIEVALWKLAQISPDIDEKELAEELAPLIKSSLTALDKATLEDIAEAVADELAERAKD